MKWAGHVEHMREKENVYRILAGITERTHLEDLSTDGTIILKWILKKQERMLWTGLTYLRMGTEADCVNTVINFGFNKMQGIS
jgi:hypothetical protein